MYRNHLINRKRFLMGSQVDGMMKYSISRLSAAMIKKGERVSVVIFISLYFFSFSLEFLMAGYGGESVNEGGRREHSCDMIVVDKALNN